MKSVAESMPEEMDNEEGDDTSDPLPKRTSRKPRTTTSKPAPKRKAPHPESSSSRRTDAQPSDNEESEPSRAPSPVVKVEGRPRSLPKGNGKSGRWAKRAVIESEGDEEGKSKESPVEAVAQVDEPESRVPVHEPSAEEEKPSSEEEEDLIPQSSIRASAAPPSSRVGRGSAPPISRVGHTSISGPRPSAVPEEPEIDAGPKARLVIHKMALVNFKSYKGRQEIGPFHKVFMHTNQIMHK